MTERYLLGLVMFVLLWSFPGAAYAADGYEVWVIDQSDSKWMKHGGTLYIFAGADLVPGAKTAPGPKEVIDLGRETSAMCLERTGANPVRPHMVLFNQQQTHALIAYVASGHVVIMDAAARKPLDCIRTTKSEFGQQAHAAYPAPDGSYVLVANQNGKRLERIDTDFRTNRFKLNEAATLDLATCKTPSGAACQDKQLRPDNAPICPMITEEGDLAFVTLRGGGMLVVDPRPTPMRIVAEYDMATVKGNGCGGAQLADTIYVNSGGRPGPMEHLHLYGFDVYRFPLKEFRKRKEFNLNMPRTKVVFSAKGERDSHGMVLTGRGRYVWVMDRHGDVVEVLTTADDRHVNKIALNGPLTSNAAPDLTDISPTGDLVFVALRGPTPLSGDPHNATGATPGMGIIEISQGGRSGRLAHIVRMSNRGEDGIERADPHGLRVRVIKAKR